MEIIGKQRTTRKNRAVKMIQATTIKILPGYKLLIGFNTNETKFYDFTKDLKQPVFAKLKNEILFSKAKIVSGGIVWDDETDIAIEHLYEQGTPALKA